MSILFKDESGTSFRGGLRKQDKNRPKSTEFVSSDERDGWIKVPEIIIISFHARRRHKMQNNFLYKYANKYGSLYIIYYIIKLSHYFIIMK